ncbi:MAG: hypothetical protein AAFX06_04535 [Planctomycetota bacterium]
MINPYQPPPEDSDQPGQRIDAAPVCIYTALNNFDAHALVTWLEAHDIPAFAFEDVAGTNVSILGSINDLHAPQVFVDTSDVEAAVPLIKQFEVRRRERQTTQIDADGITATCEECGQSSQFPAKQNGTTQTCPKCRAYMDVGTDDWPDDFDFGEADEVVAPPSTLEETVQRARKLDATGEWEQAIEVYRDAYGRWPEEETYFKNCIAEIQRKIDAARG